MTRAHASQIDGFVYVQKWVLCGETLLHNCMAPPSHYSPPPPPSLTTQTFYSYKIQMPPPSPPPRIMILARTFWAGFCSDLPLATVPASIEYPRASKAGTSSLRALRPAACHRGLEAGAARAPADPRDTKWQPRSNTPVPGLK